MHFMHSFSRLFPIPTLLPSPTTHTLLAPNLEGQVVMPPQGVEGCFRCLFPL